MSTPNPGTTPWVPMWNLNGGMDLRYNGAWQAGQYYDGDVVVYNGVTYLCVRPTTKAPTPWVPGNMVVQPSVRVARVATNFSIPNAVWTLIPFDTVRWDRGPSPHWVVGSPTRLTCQVAGTYVVTATFQFAASAAGSTRFTMVSVNGAWQGIGGPGPAPTSGANGPPASAASVVSLNVGDYVELVAYQDTGAAMATNPGGNYGTELSMALVGGMQGPAGIGVPTPVQNNQWLKGSGGAVVYTGIAEDTAWLVPTLLNSWGNYGGPFATVRYRKQATGLVLVDGLVNNSGSPVAGSVIFTLPVGYRPISRYGFPCASNGGATRVDVYADGTVALDTITAGVTPQSYLFLDSIRFLAEQ